MLPPQAVTRRLSPLERYGQSAFEGVFATSAWHGSVDTVEAFCMEKVVCIFVSTLFLAYLGEKDQLMQLRVCYDSTASGFLFLRFCSHPVFVIPQNVASVEELFTCIVGRFRPS